MQNRKHFVRFTSTVSPFDHQYASGTYSVFESGNPVTNRHCATIYLEAENNTTGFIDLQVFRQPNKSISEVAYELGFEYPQYFSRLFKKKEGLSPSEYRERYRMN